ncbi:MAG: methionyl-tRNA formyltransferase [Bowdeniella nasicola]|nr:methionyl-tRNA formyltransferase [Bowdeniella nasicola]
MRLIVAGTPEVAVPALRELVAHHDVVGVITMPDARGRRGKTRHPSPLAVAATDVGLEVVKTATLKTPEIHDWLRTKEADAVAVIAYGALVPESALNLARYGWINLHFSLLPAYRGAAPVQRSIEAGEEHMGVSVFVIDRGLDTGPLLARREVDLPPRVTAGEALATLADRGAPVLRQALEDLAAGALTPVPQEDHGVSLAPQLTSAEGRLDFSQSADVLDRKIRAFSPNPGTWTVVDGVRVKIHAARPSPPAVDLEPGQFALRDNAAVVGTGEGALVLERLQPAGRKVIEGHAWVRGWRGTQRFEEER